MSVLPNDVINALFNPEEKVNIRIFSDRKDTAFTGLNLEVEAGKFDSIKPILIKHNKENRGIAFVVNSGGKADRDITKINAQFMECDDKSFDEQLNEINKFKFPPSIIIKTRKSLHTYWIIENGDVSLFRPIQKALVSYFNADPNCVNEARCMRLPGFMHCKEEPLEVECILFKPERRYTQDQFIEALNIKDIDKKPESEKYGTEKGIDIVLETCDFIKHCKEDAKTLKEHDWYAMITNLATFEKGTETIHEMSKPYPTYDKDVTNKKIQHFLSSGTSPITCKVIAEKGYKCPKLESGECNCKSPAGLCFKPLSYEYLKKKLSDIEVKGNAVEDVSIAKKFIDKYLMNQDLSFGETFINYDIKDKFRFKSTESKVLLSEFKELRKKIEERKEAKNIKNNMAEDLPWYESNSKGVKFMPKILAKHLKDTENVIHVAEEFYQYCNGVYKTVHADQIKKIIQDNLLDREAKDFQISDTVNQYRIMILKDLKLLNPNPYIINVRNGLYNVEEDKLYEHTPDYYSTVQLNVSYDNNADCPLFKKFLNDAMSGDESQIKLIQEMLGYFLIPTQAAQKSFVVVGVAAAGKSLLLRVINDILLGKDNVSNVSWQALNERFKTAELFGKLANIFADLPTKNIDDNGIFKALVGEDYLTVEKKNKNPFSFQSYARLLFSCNAIPKNYGDKSEGFYRRLIIIKFNKAVPEEKRDPDLIYKFQSEADGIFKFALEGLKRLMSNNYVFGETEVNREALQQYKEDSDSILSFVRDCCAFGDEFKVSSSEIYDAYKDYCEKSGLRPYAQNTFVLTLLQNEKLFKKRDSMSRRFIIYGIKLSDERD